MVQACSAPIGWGIELDFKIFVHFIHFQPTFKQHELRRLQRRKPVVSRLWSRLCYSDGKRSRPKNTTSSQESRLPAWTLLLSQKQEFLNNHLAQIPVTPKEQGTIEMREEVLASAGALDVDTKTYQLSAFDDIEFFSNYSRVELDDVFRPSLYTPFSPTAFNDLAMGEGSSSENPIVLVEKRTRRTFPQQLQCLSFPPNLPSCSKLVLLEDGLKMCRISFIGLC